MSNVIADTFSQLTDSLAVIARDAGRWTNAHADQCASIRNAIIRWQLFEHPPEPAPCITRPFNAWGDFDGVLMSMIRSPHGVESGWGFSLDARALLWIARQSAQWQQANVPVPRNLRIVSWGTIVIEWPTSNLLFAASEIIVSGRVPVTWGADKLAA